MTGMGAKLRLNCVVPTKLVEFVMDSSSKIAQHGKSKTKRPATASTFLSASGQEPESALAPSKHVRPGAANTHPR